MTTGNDDCCSMCGNSRLWHNEHNPRHPFMTDEGPLRPPESTSGVRPTSMPMDPVLRMALIDAGVITTDQLDAAEKKIRFLTGGLSNGGQVREADFQSGSEKG